jgi:hypothetical protein
VIPRNRPTTTEAEIARGAGIPLATWRRNEAPTFRQRVPPLFPDSRFLVYDQAQADAYLAGKPIPALPRGEHPEDRLNDKEAAAVLGVEPETVRSYATQGHLTRGEKVGGTRVWPRREIEDRRDNPPGQGHGGGRTPGPQPRRKDHPYQDDPRLQIATAALADADGTPPTRIAADLARQHGGSTRTWERLLSQAQEMTTS